MNEKIAAVLLAATMLTTPAFAATVANSSHNAMPYFCYHTLAERPPQLTAAPHL